MIPQCELKEEKKEKILYESNGSNATTIELNEDISNYDEYEILYSLGGINNVKSNVKVRIGDSALLNGAIMGYFDNSYYAIRIFSGRASISGTTLTKVIGYVQSLKVDGTMVFTDALNDIYIHRVIGYKK